MGIKYPAIPASPSSPPLSPHRAQPPPHPLFPIAILKQTVLPRSSNTLPRVLVLTGTRDLDLELGWQRPSAGRSGRQGEPRQRLRTAVHRPHRREPPEEDSARPRAHRHARPDADDVVVKPRRHSAHFSLGIVRSFPCSHDRSSRSVHKELDLRRLEFVEQFFCFCFPPDF
jgi:hypothetical protein